MTICDFLLVGHCMYSSILYHFLSYLTLSNIVTLKSGLRVTQDHSNWYHSKTWVWFLFAFHSNYGCILHDFRDIAKNWSKIVIFKRVCIFGPKGAIQIRYYSYYYYYYYYYAYLRAFDAPVSNSSAGDSRAMIRIRFSPTPWVIAGVRASGQTCSCVPVKSSY